LRRELDASGAAVATVNIRLVNSIPKGESGKTPLFRKVGTLANSCEA
jgi:hypothetical protein